MSIERFKEGIDELVAGIRALPEMPKEDAKAAIGLLKKHYRRLHAQMVATPTSSLRGLSRDQWLVVRSLEMGKESFEQFHSKILPRIQSKAKDTAVAIAEFTKSAEAFALINSTKMSSMDDEDQEHLHKLLGGILGVSVGKDFVRSVKGEMLGRVIAYALAGLCKKDLDAFNALSATRPKLSRDKFLLSRIVASEAELTYRIRWDEKAEEWQVACAIDEHAKARPTSIKPKQRADICMVNHETKAIVFGNVTSNHAANKKQSQPIFRLMKALQLMVSERYIGGDPNLPNPYYGYTINPLYFHTGSVPVEDVYAEAKGTGAALFNMLREDGAKLSKKDHRAIAKLAFFSLLGEPDPTPETAKMLSLLNVHICGCDTFDLYKAMRSALRPSAPPRAFALLCLRSLNEALDVLSRPNTTVSLVGKGQNLLRPSIEAIIAAASNHFDNFPVIRASEVGTDEYQLLHRLGKGMKELAQKIADGNSGKGADLRRNLLGAAAHLSSRKSLSDLIAMTNDGPSGSPARYTWDAIAHAELAEHMGLGLNSPKARARIVDSILDDLSHRRMPPVMAQAIQVAMKGKKNGLSQAEWVEGLVTQAENTILGGRAVDKLMVTTATTRNSFITTFGNVERNSAEGHPAVALIRALRPLYRPSIWTPRSKMSANQDARAAIDELVDELLLMDPSVPGAKKLFATFSELAHPGAKQQKASAPPSSSPPSKRRSHR